jgi:peptide/nickel transport system substrate-binding protein
MTISRRETLKLALASIAASPLLARSQQPPNVLRVGVGTSLTRLDPLMTSIGEDYIYDNLVFNGLTRMAEDQSIQPDLAERWTFSTDLKTWTFKLRRGVRFHDGTEMSSADVVALFQRLLDPSTAAPSASNFEMISSVTAPDPATVVFGLSMPYGGFADLLSDRQVKIVPRYKVGELNTMPTGTGPFKFISYTPGDRLVLAKNPHYFETGLPKLDGVTLLIIPETSAKLAALRSGALDVIWDLPLDQVKSLAADKSIRVESVPSGAWDAAAMNNRIAPFHDPRVRMAFQMAVSKKDVVELTLFGQGVPTISTIPPSHPFYAHEITTPEADPIKARDLLAQAGYPNGIKIPLVVPVGRPVRERLGVTLQQLLKPVGFDLEIRRVPYSSYAAEVVGKVPLCTNGFFERPTIDASTFPFMHSKGSWNATLWHYSDPVVDAALVAARMSGDKGEQRKQYVAMQQELVKNPASFFAYSTNFACAYRPAVTGIRTHPMRWFDLRHTTVA